MSCKEFVPFDDIVEIDTLGGFEIDRIAKLLELSVMQTTLLRYLLRGFVLSISYWEDNAADGPVLDLNLYFEGLHVTEINLVAMLEAALAETDVIGDEKELVVLESLQAIVTAEIKRRRDRLQQDAAGTRAA